MAITDVRQYFKDRMYALGYNEWTDAFNIENIPSSILDKSFHVESGAIASSASNHQPHRFDCSITTRLFLKGYNNPSEAVDDAYVHCEDILGEILSPSNRLGTNVHDVQPVSIAVDPLTASNDNSVVLIIIFNAITFMKF